MKVKRVLITGATNGIGKQAALKIAALGAAVTIVGRNESKTRAVCSGLQAGSGNDNVDWLLGDLSSMDEVRRVAEAFRARHERLDVLLNNAGVVSSEYQASADGYEMTFALNHMSYYLLTLLLLDMLKTTAQEEGEARIINVSSSVHKTAKREDIQPAALRKPAKFRSFRAYGASKLLNLYFTYELARRLDSSRVTVNAVHPGFVNTGLSTNISGILPRVLKLVMRVFGTTPQVAARTIVYLATAPEIAGINGKYWSHLAVQESNELSHDREAQQRIWDFSAEISGLG